MKRYQELADERVRARAQVQRIYNHDTQPSARWRAMGDEQVAAVSKARFASKFGMELPPTILCVSATNSWCSSMMRWKDCTDPYTCDCKIKPQTNRAGVRSERAEWEQGVRTIATAQTHKQQ